MKTDNPIFMYLSGIDIDRVKIVAFGLDDPDKKTQEYVDGRWQWTSVQATDKDLADILDGLGIEYYSIYEAFAQLDSAGCWLCEDCRYWCGLINDDLYVPCACVVEEEDEEEEEEEEEEKESQCPRTPLVYENW